MTLHKWNFTHFGSRCFLIVFLLSLISGDTLEPRIRRHASLTVWPFFSCLVTLTFLSIKCVCLRGTFFPKEGSHSPFKTATAAIWFEANSHLLNMTLSHHLSLWWPRNLTNDLVLAVSMSGWSFHRQKCCWCVLCTSHVGSLLGEIIHLLT